MVGVDLGQADWVSEAQSCGIQQHFLAFWMGLLILPLNCWKSTKYAKNFEKLLTGNCQEFFFINLQLILYLIVKSQVVLGRIMYKYNWSHWCVFVWRRGLRVSWVDYMQCFYMVTHFHCLCVSLCSLCLCNITLSVYQTRWWWAIKALISCVTLMMLIQKYLCSLVMNRLVTLEKTDHRKIQLAQT